MPGRFFLTSDLSRITGFLGAIPGGRMTLSPRRNIAPGQDILVCPPDRRLRLMRWGMIPVGRVNARGRPVMETIINARSETLFSKSAFQGVRRCLVPADGWYEWTGEKRRKAAWRISPRSGGLLAFAGIFDIWKGPGGIAVPQIATVTCEPSADVRDIHHRMAVILSPDTFDAWLTGSEDQAQDLMRPWPDGSLTVEPATGVTWDAG